MNAVLDRRVELSKPTPALLESNETSQRAKVRHPRDARNTARGEIDTVTQSAVVLLQGADGILSTVVAGALLIVSVGFSVLMIAAMLVVFLCGLACYS